ncbi:MAG: glutamate-cysteine ligase family protein [Pseudomonadota bacterium]|nr:glutamate-cysteine ligase family protein [Pseudomonadota bacterium]
MAHSDKIDRHTCHAFINDNVFAVRRQPDYQDKVGVEIETIPILNSTAPVPFISNEPSAKQLRPLLHELAIAENWVSTFDDHDPYTLDSLRIELGVAGHLTFEPAAQIEYSSPPVASITPLRKHTDAILHKLTSHLAAHSISLIQLGINPWHTVEQLGLQVKKQHYLMMQKHFKLHAPIGLRMMRQTCATQINLDYGNNDQTLVKRYLACLLLAPYSAAIFANSTVWDQTNSDCLGFRSRIWQTADASRTGFPTLTGLFDKTSKQSLVASYVEFAINAKVIALVNDTRLSGATFSDWLDADLPHRPTLADFQTHLRTLFPEVRPQGYFELRSVDAQAPVWQYVPLGFYLGLVYSDSSVEQVLARLAPAWQATETQMHRAAQGLRARDSQFIATAKWLFDLAINASLPHHWLDTRVQRAMQCFAERFTYQEKTPADEINNIFTASGHFTPNDLRALTMEWEKLL